MEVPMSQEASLVGQHAPGGSNNGLSVAQVQDAQPHSGILTQAASEAEVNVAIPANVNTGTVQAVFTGGNLVIQYWDQTQGGGVGAYVVLKTITGVVKAVITVKICLRDASAAPQSWYSQSMSGDAIIAGWYEKNAQSGANYRMIGAPERILRDNMGSAPMVATDQGATLMVQSLPITRSAQMDISSSRAMVGLPLLIPIEVSVEVLA